MIVVDTITAFIKMTRVLDQQEVVAVDIETTGLDPHTDVLLLVSFAIEGESFVVDFARVPVEACRYLAPIVSSPNIVKVLHNAVFDVKFLTPLIGAGFSNIHCTMIAEQLLKSGLLFSGFGLDDVAQRRLGVEMDKNIRKGFIGRDPADGFTTEELQYSATDVEVLLPIYHQQVKELTEENQTRLFTELEMPLVPVTASMEYIGVCVDEQRMVDALPVIDHIVERADRVL